MQSELSNVVIGFFESLVVTLTILAVLHFLIKRGRVTPYLDKSSLRSLLYDEKGYASLSQFQFVTWTFVFLFSLLWIYFVRIQGDVLGFPPAVPIATLSLMGINTASVIASKNISQGKQSYSKLDVQDPPGSLWHMLFDESKGETKKLRPSLARVQLFVWTIVSVIIYLAILLSVLAGPYLFGFAQTSLTTLSLPDVDPSLVTLMGLSHVGFLGTKLATAV